MTDFTCGVEGYKLRDLHIDIQVREHNPFLLPPFFTGMYTALKPFCSYHKYRCSLCICLQICTSLSFRSQIYFRSIQFNAQSRSFSAIYINSKFFLPKLIKDADCSRISQSATGFIKHAKNGSSVLYLRQMTHI